MYDYKSSRENLFREKIRIESDRKKIEEDLFKYRNRGDYSAAENCIEERGRLQSKLTEINKEIARLDRIIENGGVDPFEPDNTLQISNDEDIHEGTEETSIEMTLEVKGTKGKGKNRTVFNESQTQKFTKTQEYKNGIVVDEITTIDKDFSIKPITNKTKTLKGSPTAKSSKKVSSIWSSKKKSVKNNKFPSETHWIKKDGKWHKPHKTNKKGFIKKNSTEKQLMDDFINYLKMGNSWIKSANFAGVSVGQVNTWYRQGFNNASRNTTYFYNNVKFDVPSNVKIKNIDKSSNDKLSKNDVKSSSNVNSVNQSSNSSQQSILLNKKRKGFKQDNVKKKPIKGHEKTKMDIVLYNLKQGKTLKQTSEITGVSVDTINLWISQGYLRSIKIDSNIESKKIPIEDRIELMDSFLNDLRNINEFAFRINVKNSLNLLNFNIGKVSKKFEIKKSQILNEFQINNKIISSFNFSGCDTLIDFTYEKIEIEDQLQKELLKIDSSNNKDLSIESQNKISLLKSKIKEIDIISVLLKKQNELNKEMENISIKINELKKQLDMINIERKEMDNFLNAFRRLKSCEDASNEVNIEIVTIINWIDHGKHSTDENKIYFYKEFNRIKNEISSQKNHEIQSKNKENNISELLVLLNEGKTKYEACHKTGVSVRSFDCWYREGRDGKGNLNVEFYNRVNEINSIKENNRKIQNRKNKENKNQKIKMNSILSDMKEGNSRFQAAEKEKIPIKTIDKWYNQGMNGYSDNTIYFHDQINQIEYVQDELKKMKTILNELKNLKTLDVAINVADTDRTQVNIWLDNGKHQLNENTRFFYEEMKKICEDELYKMGIVLDALKNGEDRLRACEIAGIKLSDLNSWINKGRQGLNSNAKMFFKEYKKISIEDDYIDIKIHKSKFCPKCGCSVNASDNFCSCCGHKLSNNIKRERKSIFDKIKNILY